MQDRVDIVTGTLGKALGGASGGYVSAPAEIVELLRQRSRPYLFSNAVAPSVVAGSLAALDLVAGSDDASARPCVRNTALFRQRMTDAGFDVLPGEHPIIAGHVRRRQRSAADRRRDAATHGVYVIAFSYPVVPQGKARIRVQLSAAHSDRGRRDLRAGVRRGPAGDLAAALSTSAAKMASRTYRARPGSMAS